MAATCRRAAMPCIGLGWLRSHVAAVCICHSSEPRRNCCVRSTWWWWSGGRVVEQRWNSGGSVVVQFAPRAPCARIIVCRMSLSYIHAHQQWQFAALGNRSSCVCARKTLTNVCTSCNYTVLSRGPSCACQKSVLLARHVCARQLQPVPVARSLARSQAAGRICSHTSKAKLVLRKYVVVRPPPATTRAFCGYALCGYAAKPETCAPRREARLAGG